MNEKLSFAERKRNFLTVIGTTGFGIGVGVVVSASEIRPEDLEFAVRWGGLAVTLIFMAVAASSEKYDILSHLIIDEAQARGLRVRKGGFLNFRKTIDLDNSVSS